MKRLCSPYCMYFPNSYSCLLREYKDSNNIEHREAIYLCDYDDHRIREFEICENFRSNGVYWIRGEDNEE